MELTGAASLLSGLDDTTDITRANAGTRLQMACINGESDYLLKGKDRLATTTRR